MKRGPKKREILKSLTNISGFINFVENPDLILGLVIEECVLLTGAEWGILLSCDANLNLDTFQATRPLGDKERNRMSSFFSKRIEAIIDAGRKGALLERHLKEATGKDIRGALICPIEKKDLFLGLAIVINKRQKGSFTKEDGENLAILCQEASIVLENINLFKAKIQSEKMAAIGQTITGISHYVKNILQGISAGSYLLDTGIRSKDIRIITEAWTVVNKNAKRISELVLDMLYYSKSRKPAKEKIDPKVLIDDVLELVRPALKQKKIRLVLSIKEIPPYMVLNEKGFHRSILNLMTNAIDACDKPDSVISFKTVLDRPRQVLKVTISDNGRGISKEDQGRLFQPFYTNKEAKGTGLGLAITKKVIEEHDGSIRYESELAKGAKFEISIPVRQK